MIYGLYVVVFLLILNGFLRGAKQKIINVVLSMLLIGFTTIIFIVAGWKFGLIAIAIIFISTIVTLLITDGKISLKTLCSVLEWWQRIFLYATSPPSNKIPKTWETI